MIIEQFPEAFIQLQLEMGNHPRLIQRCAKHENLGMETIFAEICYYCGIAINAELDGEQLEALADRLIWKLRDIKPLPAMTPMEELLSIDDPVQRMWREKFVQMQQASIARNKKIH